MAPIIAPTIMAIPTTAVIQAATVQTIEIVPWDLADALSPVSPEEVDCRRNIRATLSAMAKQIKKIIHL